MSMMASGRFLLEFPHSEAPLCRIKRRLEIPTGPQSQRGEKCRSIRNREKSKEEASNATEPRAERVR